MLCGYPPEIGVRQNPCMASLDPYFWKDISRNAKDFVLQLLQRDPSKRLSGLRAASHIWLLKE